MNYTFLNSHLKFNTTQKVIDQIDAAIVAASLLDVEMKHEEHYNRYMYFIDWHIHTYGTLESILYIDDYSNLCRIELHAFSEERQLVILIKSFDKTEEDLVNAFKMIMTYL